METSSPSSFMLHRRRARYLPGYATRLAEEGAHIAVAALDQTAAAQTGCYGSYSPGVAATWLSGCD
jgi:hypothetical protein